MQGGLTAFLGVLGGRQLRRQVCVCVCVHVTGCVHVCASEPVHVWLIAACLPACQEKLLSGVLKSTFQSPAVPDAVVMCVSELFSPVASIIKLLYSDPQLLV